LISAPGARFLAGGSEASSSFLSLRVSLNSLSPQESRAYRSTHHWVKINIEFLTEPNSKRGLRLTAKERLIDFKFYIMGVRSGSTVKTYPYGLGKAFF
jgi:hypothetical protein